MNKAEKNLVCLTISLACTLIFTSHLEAANLTVSSESGSAGEKNISIPIDLTSAPAEEVCSFNFDLSFDTSRLSFKEVTLGPKAAEANKSLSYNQPNSSRIIIVVIGFNKNIIGNGTVLNFTFDILVNALPGKADLIITDPAISDTDLNPNHLPVTIENGGIIVKSEPLNSTKKGINYHDK